MTSAGHPGQRCPRLCWDEPHRRHGTRDVWPLSSEDKPRNVLWGRIRGSLGRRRGPGRASGEQTRRVSSLSRWASSSPRGHRSWPGGVRIRTGPSQPERPRGSVVFRPRAQPWGARPGAAGAPAQGLVLGHSGRVKSGASGRCVRQRRRLRAGAIGLLSTTAPCGLRRLLGLSGPVFPCRDSVPRWSLSHSGCSLGQQWSTLHSRGAATWHAHVETR